MKKITILFFTLLLGVSLFAQDEEKKLKLSLQTDILSYSLFNPSGYSIWLGGQKNLNQILLVFENNPDVEQSYHLRTGIKEDENLLRLVLSRYVGSDKWYKNFYYGLNLEYYWSDLEEIVTREQQNKNNFRIGTQFGYSWTPWRKKSNFLRNLDIIPWAAVNYRLNNDETTTFEVTGNIHDNQDKFYFPFGLNISFTLYQK